MQVAWDSGEKYHDPAFKGDFLGRTPGFVGRKHLKDPIAALAKALVCLEHPYLVLASGS